MYNEDGLQPVERGMTMHQLLMHTAGFSGFHLTGIQWINCMLRLT